MPRERHLPPSASALSTSMRDLGYSLETAVADLVDNSISAGASRVEIICDLVGPQPTLAILDNGQGMSGDELLTAMRHGAAGANQKRDPDDLGRFGLGLKTASFSQCRQLTVASARDGSLVAAEWNLDLVDQKDEWVLTLFDQSEAQSLPCADRLDSTGTLVIWRNLDRLFEDETGPRRDEIVNEKLDLLDKHLALVFHRFLSGDVPRRKKLSISINGHEVEPFDPFCKKNAATQLLPEEVVRIDGHTVTMQPYILPHHSKLSPAEYEFYQSRSEFISNQGAYVYRNGRLMAWGDWFRLVPKGEAIKLARVQIDFPSSLDGDWTIDIRKSQATPPRAVRDRLRQVINRIMGRSTTVHRGRGKKLFEEIKAPLWERFADQGRIRYAINRSHPLVERLKNELEGKAGKAVEVLLQAVASALPVEMIYSDYSTNPRDVRQFEMESEAVRERLRELKRSLFGGQGGDAESFREVMRSTRLFEDYLEEAENFIREEFN
ncbi:MAG: ATP-binding protein [Gammaproteobacteria bacterium]